MVMGLMRLSWRRIGVMRTWPEYLSIAGIDSSNANYEEDLVLIALGWEQYV